MSKVLLTVGVSGSGKSTWAKEFIIANPNWVITCRDDIRVMQGFPPVGNSDQERIITKLQRGSIEAALLDGYNVIVADTNLNNGLRKNLVDYVHKLGHDVEFHIFDVDLATCIERDAGRAKSVGEIIVRKQFARFQSLKAEGFSRLEDSPVETYTPYVHVVGENRPEVIVADIDGTVAEGHRRSPYDYSRVIDDDPIEDVLAVLNSLSLYSDIIFVSGRSDDCRPQTEEWLNTYFGDSYKLFMRKAGDERPDYIIKNEIYDAEIIPKYNIRMVFDDRDQVIRHLRVRGITVAQVAYGRF